MKKALLLKTTLALALATPLLASAESDVTTGSEANAGNVGASARLNFSITIPRFIALQVGTAGGTVDTVDFVLTEAQASATGAVAPATGSPVNVSLRANVGNVDLESTGADLTNGSETIPLTRLSVPTTTGNLAHPAFNGSISVVPNIGTSVISRTGTWAYSYDHQGAGAAAPGAGTYTTVVTYTASAP